MNNNSEKDREKTINRLGPYMNLGWVMAVTILLLTYLGWWLDKKFGISPVLTVIGAFLGSILGLVNFIRTVQKLSKKQ